MKLAQRILNQVFAIGGLQVAKLGSSWTLVEPEQLKRFTTKFAIDCVFDVGANEGQYAAMLRSIGYAGLIISFEPNPAAFSVLQKRSRGDDRWIVKEMALDSTSREAKFNIMASSQFSSLRDAGDELCQEFEEAMVVERAITLTTARLDEIYDDLKREYGFKRPLLKLDTQGHDVQVVEGAGGIIGEFAGLQSELALSAIYAGSCDYHMALSLYRSLGFRLCWLIPNNQGHFPDLFETDCLMYNPKFEQF